MADEHPNPAPWDGSEDSNAEQQGGEWTLLTTTLKEWWTSESPQLLWEQLRTPLKLLGWLLALLLVLRVYGAVLTAIESFPLLPGLLELTGLAWLGRFAADNLLLRKTRDQLFSKFSRIWSSPQHGP